MSDGLNAEQEAKRRWPTAAPWTPTPAQGQNAMHFAFVSGAEWATEREKARAEAAEAALRAIRDGAVTCADLPRCGKGRHDPQCAKAIAAAALAAPTTEEVTE